MTETKKQEKEKIINEIEKLIDLETLLNVLKILKKDSFTYKYFNCNETIENEKTLEILSFCFNGGGYCLFDENGEEISFKTLNEYITSNFIK